MDFKLFTVGWEPDFIEYLLSPIEKRAGLDCTHGLVGDATRVAYARTRYPGSKFIALSKSKHEPLPAPDYELLARLEAMGVPTVKSMIQGDRVLRHLDENVTLGYATLLAQRLQHALKEARPDIVLGSFDSIHAAMSLAVAKSLGIPWVAMAFSVIPDTLTGFCNSMTPNALLPITRPVDERLRSEARVLMENVRSKKQKVLAYHAPTSLTQWLRQHLAHGKNLLRRQEKRTVFGIDQFTYPSVKVRFQDISRRALNRIRLPTREMITTPPKTRFVYYPFHMAPESMLDTWAPFYQNQLAFVAQLSLAIPADTAFVIKLHFSDPDNYSHAQLRELMRLPRLYIANPTAPGRDFIEKAALVVGIQGTSCLEAALLRKPVLIFGDSPYQRFPRTQVAKRPSELHGQIQQMLELSVAGDDEIVEAYAAHMARYMPGRINDWGRPIEPDALDQFANCFGALRSYLAAPGVRASWYSQPPFEPAPGTRV
jgi:hypothetical protein